VFSRVFLRETGASPREWREMVFTRLHAH